MDVDRSTVTKPMLKRPRPENLYLQNIQSMPNDLYPEYEHNYDQYYDQNYDEVNTEDYAYGYEYPEMDYPYTQAESNEQPQNFTTDAPSTEKT